MDITIQRGDQGAFGQHYLIAPMTTETKKNFHSCFEVNGTKAAKISAQTVLPNPANFSVSFKLRAIILKLHMSKFFFFFKGQRAIKQKTPDQ